MKKINFLFAIIAVMIFTRPAMATVAAPTDQATNTNAAVANPEDTAKSAIASFKLQASTTQKIAKLQEAGQAYISSRVNTLAAVLTRISALKINDAATTNLKNQVNSQISDLNGLMTQISNESDLTKLKDDVKSIFNGHYIYALFVPSVHASVASDRLETVSTKLTALEPKIEAYLSGLKTKGVDITAGETAFGDFKTQITIIQSATQAANDKIAALNLSDFSNSKTLMTQVKVSIKTAQQALAKASGDLNTISGLSK
jgi:hypothetical protein